MKCKNIFSAESFKAEFSKAFPEFRENPVEFFTLMQNAFFQKRKIFLMKTEILLKTEKSFQAE